MSAGANFIIEQGLNVEQREYNNNGNKGEWYFINTQLDYWNDYKTNMLSYWKTDPKVYIQIDQNLNTAFFNGKINEAIEIWNEALNINIETTTSPYDAGITLNITTKQNYIEINNISDPDDKEDVRTSDGITHMGRGSYLFLYYGSSQKTVFKRTWANIGIFVHDETKPDLVLYVILHELGHALGYDDHSPVITDVMYETTGERINLSKSEINHLKQLYDQRSQLP